MKRILAIIGALLLVLLYVLTFVFSRTDDPRTMSFFRAAVALTILVPVMIYGYQLVYRLVAGNKKKGEE